MISNYSGVSQPRAHEDVDDRICRILREFGRAVPIDLIARLAELPESDVSEATRLLADRGAVTFDGYLVRLR